MKINKTIVFALMVLSLMTILGTFASAAATATVSMPSASSYNSGTMAVGCNTTSKAVINATIIYGIAGGTNYTVYMANTSADQTTFSDLAANIASRADSASYIFTCVVLTSPDAAQNRTYSATVSSVTIDNTDPSITATLNGPRTVERYGSSQVICRATDGIDSSLTFTRSLVRPDATTVTTTEDLHTFLDTDFNQRGDYTFNCSAVDDSGNSASKTLTITAEDDGEDRLTGTGISGTQQTAIGIGTANASPVILVIFMGGFVILAVGLYLLLGKKVKRRKVR